MHCMVLLPSMITSQDKQQLTNELNAYIAERVGPIAKGGLRSVYQWITENAFWENNAPHTAKSSYRRFESTGGHFYLIEPGMRRGYY